MHHRTHPLTAALFGSALLALTPASHAEPAGGLPQAAPEQMATVDNATLSNFVSAYSKISGIRQDFTVQLAQAKSEDEAKALQQRVQTKMIKAVESSGLSVQEYNEVVMALDRDPALRDSLMAMIAAEAP